AVMTRRTITDRQRGWLHDELEVWRQHGIVSFEQAGKILDLYESTTEVADRQRSRAVFTLMSVAALLVGLAVLLVIGYNWEDLPSPVKLALIFGVLLGTHAAGFWLRYRRQARTLSEVVFFLGCLLYGAG